MKEKYEKNIHIEGVTANAMELVLDFLYTTSIDLVEENVRDVLDAASLMRLSRTIERKF